MDLGFAARYAAVDNPNMMVGIPIYGPEPTLHDYTVQAAGAFDDTVRGILNIGRVESPYRDPSCPAQAECAKARQR